MAALSVEILTPEATLWSGDASSLTARSREGDFTVMAGHAALDGNVVPGLVRVASPEGELAFLVHGGVFRVASAGGDTKATVAVGIAERTTEIDVARAQAAKERAESALTAEGDDDAGRAAARADLERAERRLAAATA
ncbi:MAG TPA: ATP synthase F1 subunit epsilon [Acidimicrobiales bacterium]|nr:ATP synthase F1 subunit epsilon [Acidimicrobiales bacterium]